MANKFWHITNWKKEDISFNKTFSTSWAISNYWIQKQTNEQFTSVDSKLSEILSSLVTLKNDKEFLIHQFSKVKYYAESQKEYIFEEIRATEFQKLPSRKNCMFLLPYDSDIEGFARNYNFDKRITLEIEVETDAMLHFADISLLNCNSKTFKEKQEIARQYWKGTSRKDNDTEILFRGNFKIIRIVD
ncbi:MAG: DUF2441 domain-containing protein [Paludibacter sp.]|nr:DUF2441 domain-containing protein [Paludibacter sp.]